MFFFCAEIITLNVLQPIFRISNADIIQGKVIKSILIMSGRMNEHCRQTLNIHKQVHAELKDCIAFIPSHPGGKMNGEVAIITLEN